MRQFDGFLWLLVTLIPLLLLQRRFQRDLHAIFLLLTRRQEIALVLYALVFFPGVLLHEFSHYLTARLLGVRTGRFSIIPRPLENGRVQLGYVETEKTGILRDSLIGAAPLVLGSLFVAYAGIVHFRFALLWQTVLQGSFADLWASLALLPQQNDFWVWFYLTLTISGTMFPSQSDRVSWLPAALVMAVLLGIALLLGADQWLLANALLPLNEGLRAVSAVFAISFCVHFLLVPPVWALRRLIGSLTGLQVV